MSIPSPSNSSTTTSTTTTNSTSSSSSSSLIARRFPSPVVSRNNRSSSTPKRSQSVDRRRSGTPKSITVANAGEISAAAKLLVTSTRSLSVSFQGEAFSLPISKTKAVNQVNGSNARKIATPEKRRSTPLRGKVDGGGGDQVDYLNSNSSSKPGDQQRWPARTRVSRSLDCSKNGSQEFLGSRALKESLFDESRRSSFSGILNLDSGNGDVLNGIRGAMDANSVNDSSVPSDLTASDTDSVSSGSTSGAQEMNSGRQGRNLPRGIDVSAKFWQETNMRLRRLQEPGLGFSTSPTSKFVAPSKLSQSRKYSDGPMSSPRTMSSPVRGAVRAASPSRLTNTPASSPLRGVSPSRVRSSIGSGFGSSPWDKPSVLSFAVDVRRGKVGENRIVDAHQLRLLYNRHLQWRFVNASADAALSVQRRNAEVLNDQTFAIMVLMALVTTFMTTPIVMAVYKPAKRRRSYKVRTIQRKDPNTHLRIMACFHSGKTIPTMINLIEASRGTDKKEGITVYAMHLMELSERSSAIRMVHKARNNGLPFWNKSVQSDSDQVVVAFEAYGQLSRVQIRPMTAISHFSDMHDDICTSAESKRTALIILPFHKHQKLDGSLETTRHEYRIINKKVLQNAPCSVGILVDRGLGGSSHVSASNVDSTITVFFFGGPDDREALALGERMSEHPGITLNVVHFKADPNMEGEKPVAIDVSDDSSNGDSEEADRNIIGTLMEKLTEDGSVKYEERVVKTSSETIDMVKEFSRCNMVLVGRSPEGMVAANFGLNFKTEFPELGPVGGLLVSPDVSTNASVLVIHQYSGGSRTVSLEEEDPTDGTETD